MVPLTPPTQRKNMHGQFLWYPLRPSPLPGIARSTTESARHVTKRKRDGCWHVLSNRVRDEKRTLEKFGLRFDEEAGGDFCHGCQISWFCQIKSITPPPSTSSLTLARITAIAFSRNTFFRIFPLGLRGIDSIDSTSILEILC